MEKVFLTRMHSSRMRTGRSLTVCCSLLPGGGFSLVLEGVLLGPGGVCLVQGGFSMPGGVCLVGGVSMPEGGLPGPRGGSPETPPVDRITDTCKNITLATTSLRPVIIHTCVPDCTRYYSMMITTASNREQNFWRQTI